MDSEQFVDLSFPLAGIDLAGPFGRQMPRQVREGVWARSTPLGKNVRGFEPSSDRSRGGSRPGLSKYIETAVVEDWIVQELALVVGVGYDAPGASTVQLSDSGRIVTLVAVSQGNVYVMTSGDTIWTTATNSTGDTPPLNYTGVLFSAVNNQKLWFADGVNWVYYDPSDNTLKRWEASAGSLPVDDLNNTPRLICTWRGRIVVAGWITDPQNWAMSRINDPTDWNYANEEFDAGGAIAGNNAPQGLVGDVITALIPYSDDVLIFGCDHEIHMMSGDPQAGGQIDRVSDTIGIAWGQAWCKDPYGNLYFVSNRAGIYTMVPGQQPQRISQPVEQLLSSIDTGDTTIRMLWNDRYQGLHVWLSPTTEPAAAVHLFWEQRTGAWWTVEFADPNMDPLCCCIFDGNLPGDRVALIGSWDGYVRSVSSDAEDDDGEPIVSEVFIGPITSKNLDDFICKDLQAVLGETSGDVDYAIHVGATAELALNSEPVAEGVWRAGRNLSSPIRRSGHAIYVRIRSESAWSLEVVRARIAGKGKVRRRGA